METPYRNLLVYYFSGTGNAKKASEWIINTAQKYNIKPQLVNIDRLKKIVIPDLDGKTLIGFCFPTHGFNAPPIILKFILRFPKMKNADIFLLNTRAGMKLYKIFTPGLSGIALIFPALLLKFKGFRIVGYRPLDLPSNWIFLHPGLKSLVVNSIFGRCKKITIRFTHKILSGKRVYRGLFDLPIDLLLIPISIAYYFVGRFALAKTLVASSECDNCGLCVEKCPTNSIRLKDNRPFWSHSCESCMRCVNICPKSAIQVAHSYTALIWICAFTVIMPFFYRLIFEKAIISLSKNSFWFKLSENIIGIIVFLTVSIIAYRVLHLLLKYKTFNKLITYSSLTKYKFWRRYKTPKNF